MTAVTSIYRFSLRGFEVTRKAHYEDIVVIDLATFVHPLKIEWMS
jgi:hypothetical protein